MEVIYVQPNTDLSHQQQIEFFFSNFPKIHIYTSTFWLGYDEPSFL